MTIKPKLFDIFSGIGSMSFGLERAGFETVAFCEIDEYCRYELKRNWPNTEILKDISNVCATLGGSGCYLSTNNDFTIHLGYIRVRINGPIFIEGGIDLMCGGPPCQGYSVAGKQKGDEDERSALWGEYARLVGEAKPKYCIFENSPNIRNHSLGRILKTFDEIGYNAEWQIISNYFIGSPHQRERIYIVFWRKDIPYCNPFRWFSPDTEKEKSESNWWAKRRFKRNPLFKQIATFEPKVLQFDDGDFEGLFECEQAVKQIGNSVNQEIIYLIGRQIISSL